MCRGWPVTFYLGGHLAEVFLLLINVRALQTMKIICYFYFVSKRPALPILLNQSHLSFSIIAGVKGSNSSIRLFGQVGNFSRVSFNHSSGFKPFSLAVPSKV